MNSLSDLDVESELSYAYIHAVAAKAGMECVGSGRHSDNRGIDATINGWGLETGTYKNSASVHIQLKATVSVPSVKNNALAYFMDDVGRYDDLRSVHYQIPRILVVLFLPKNKEQWLQISNEQLILKRCAYWTSLLDAPVSANKSGQTIYLPQSQVFNPQELRKLLTKIANRQPLKYRIDNNNE